MDSYGSYGPGSRALRNGRTQIDIARPSTRFPGRYIVHTTLRYPTYAQARKVAEGLPVDNDHALVSLTSYSARDGWQSHAGEDRKDGVWRNPAGIADGS